MKINGVVFTISYKLMAVLQNRILNHFKSKNFFDNKKSLLLAVSGGVDSMVLLHLMQQTDNQIAVAHVDHHTRKNQSAEDAQFVEKYCHKNSIPFHLAHFRYDEHAYGNFHQQSHIFRYNFFRSLDYDLILTAHHKDDHIETIMLNFLNGKSTLGIAEQKRNVVRPLLEFTKEEVLEYAEEYQIDYVHDKTNETNAYDRNFLRNEIIPRLREKMTHLTEKVSRLSQRGKSDAILLQKLLNEKAKITTHNNRISIAKESLTEDYHFLYHIIKDLGYNRSQASDIIDSLDHTGAQFLSEDYELIINRDTLIINKLNPAKPQELTIVLDALPQKLHFGSVIINGDFIDHIEKISGSQIAYFPMYKIGNEIKVRSWKAGDMFHPYGMHGQSKLLKKFFIDEKVDRLSKSKIPIFLNKGEIIWVGGLRTDERYKWENTTGRFLRIELSPLL